MKKITLSMYVKITKMSKKGTEIVINHSARLDGENMTFAELGKFYEDFEKITSLLRKAYKSKDRIQLEIYRDDEKCKQGKVYYLQKWMLDTRDDEHDIDDFDNYCSIWKCEQTGKLEFYLKADTREIPTFYGDTSIYINKTEASHDMLFDLSLESITDRPARGSHCSH